MTSRYNKTARPTKSLRQPPPETRALIQQKLNEAIDILPEPDLRGNRHSEEVKAIAIAMKAQGYRVKMIAEKVGASESRVYDWISKHAIGSVESNTLVGAIKERLAAKTYIMADSIMSRITDEDIDKANLMQKVTASSIMIDKARLLGDESTMNINLLYKKVGEVTDKADELKKEEDVLRSELEELNRC